MWSCPNCEQNNMETAACCTLCGTEKPAPEGAPAVNGAWGNVGDLRRTLSTQTAPRPRAATPAPARDPYGTMTGPTADAPAKPSKKSRPIHIAVAVVAAILLAVALNTITNRQRAMRYLDAGDFENAHTAVRKIWFSAFIPKDDWKYLYTSVYIADQEYDEAYSLFYSLGDYRNSKELLRNYYLWDESTAFAFLEGVWEGSKMYFELERTRDGSYTSWSNLVLYPDWVARFEIVHGVYRLASADLKRYLKAFQITVIDQNCIDVYVFANATTYRLYRQ